jgi:hypothetical protein
VQVETNYLTLAIGLSVVDSVGLPLVLESSQITMPFNKLRGKKNNKRKESNYIPSNYQTPTIFYCVMDVVYLKEKAF